MTNLEGRQSEATVVDPAGRLLETPETASTLIALSKVRTRDLVLPDEVHRAYLRHTWQSRKKINAGWMLWAAALNIVCAAFAPFILPDEVLPELMAGRIAISLVLAAGAGAIYARSEPGAEGPITIASCLVIVGIVVWMATYGGSQLTERYIVAAIFMCGTAIMVSRLPWRDTRTLTIAVLAALVTALSLPATGALSVPEKLQLMAFYGAGLIGLALAKRAMNKVKYRVFVLGLVDKLKMAEIEQMNSRLHAIARTDQLTAVSNRRGFDEAYAALSTRREPATSAALFMIDIDFFKLLNDAAGHAAGDDCLRTVAGVISQELRHGQDLLARFGGEEFVAILPGVSADEAVTIANRVRKAVEARAIPNPAAEAACVTVSVGVAVSPPAPIERLVALADAALYEAKSEGRNAVRLAHIPSALRVA